MSFLAPLLLSLGLAAGVPLLLHLMRRRLGTRVEFPAVRYLARAEQEHSRRLKLRNLALMLLRVVLILLIAVAAARPVGRLAGTGHPPTALALVVDNSLSSSAVVDGAPALTRLTAAAISVLDRATADDRLWLVTADGVVRGGSASSLRDALAALAPLAGAGDLPAAAGRAASMVAAAGVPATQLLVLTDGQESGWMRPADVGSTPVSALLLPSAPPANRAVVVAEGRPPSFTPRGTVALRVVGADSVPYSIDLDGRTVARGTAADDVEVHQRVAATGEGWIAGSVVIAPDELRGDDVRHFAVRVGPPPAVRVDASAGAFVAPALDALVQSGLVVRGSDVLISAADAAGALPALLLAPSDPVRLGAANRNLERLGIPWRFGEARRGSAELSGERLDGAVAAVRYPLVAAGVGVGDTLAVAGGAPWAVAGDGYVLVGSPLEPSATTLPLRAAFVPWMGDLLTQRLSAEPVVIRSAPPGTRVSLPAWVTGWTAAGSTVVESVVDGAVTAPAEPGVYFLMRGPSRVGAILVNPEPSESVLHRLSPAALRSRLGRDASVTTDTDSFVRSAFDPAAGRSLAMPLLAGALVALVAEGWLSRRGSGSRR